MNAKTLILIIISMLIISFPCRAQFLDENEQSLISLHGGSGYFNDESNGFNIGLAVGSHNIIGEIDYIAANNGRELGGKIFREEKSIRLGYYKGIAKNSYFAFSVGPAAVTFSQRSSYFDVTKYKNIEINNGYITYGSVAVHSRMQFGINRFLGIGFKGMADFNKKAFNCGAIGFVSINLFGWNNIDD